MATEAQIKAAIEIAEDAQGEWACVTKTYSPLWTHPYKEIIDILEEEKDSTLTKE